MTELDVPPWAFILIWMIFIIGGVAVGWFLRGIIEHSINQTPTNPNNDDISTAETLMDVRRKR